MQAGRLRVCEALWAHVVLDAEARQPCFLSPPQIKALARITIKPLVETLPCFGGITLSLMEVRFWGEDSCTHCRKARAETVSCSCA